LPSEAAIVSPENFGRIKKGYEIKMMILKNNTHKTEEKQAKKKEMRGPDSVP